MPTTALLRRNAVSSIRRIATTEPLLPFLYNTRTIRCEHTDALSELDHSIAPSRPQKPRPRDREDGPKPKARQVTADRDITSRGAGGYDRENRVRKSEGPRFSRHDNAEEGLDTFTQSPRGQHRRPAREEHIPFEHAAQETMSIRDKMITSTITPSEKKAFEGLMSLQQRNSGKYKGRHRDRVDDIFGEASIQLAKEDNLNAAPMPGVLKKIQDKLSDSRSTAQRVLVEQAVSQDLLQVRKAFAEAETDVELWKILHDKVLSRVTALDLDNPARQNPTRQQHKRETRAAKGATPEETKQTEWPGNISDEIVIARSLRQHLAECALALFNDFPASQLIVTLLPYIKSLGPSTFALAASTKLYNYHIRALFRVHSNISQVMVTLEEMEREVYDFDDKTKYLVDSIRKRGGWARSGGLGEGVGALWRGERFRKAAKTAAFWAHIIEDRMQEKALREAKMMEEEVALSGGVDIAN